MTPSSVLRTASLLPLLALAACGGAPRHHGHPGDTSAISGGYAPSSSAEEDSTGPDEAVATLPAPPPDANIGIALKGLSAAQVKSTLGAPSFRRRDAPAEIWQYRSPTCTLDVFLYEEGKRQTVAHYAVRSPSGVADRDCVNELVAKVKAAPAG